MRFKSIILSMLTLFINYPLEAGYLKEMSKQILSEEQQAGRGCLGYVYELWKFYMHVNTGDDRALPKDPARAAISYAYYGAGTHLASLLIISDQQRYLYSSTNAYNHQQNGYKDDPNYFAKVEYYAGIILGAKKKHNPNKKQRFRAEFWHDSIHGTFNPDLSEPLPQPIADYLKHLDCKSQLRNQKNNGNQPLILAQNNVPPADPSSVETQYGSTPTNTPGNPPSHHGREAKTICKPSAEDKIWLEYDNPYPEFYPRTKDYLHDYNRPAYEQALDRIAKLKAPQLPICEMSGCDSSPPSTSTIPDHFTHPVSAKAIIKSSMNDTHSIDGITLNPVILSAINNSAQAISSSTNFARLSRYKNANLNNLIASLPTAKMLTLTAPLKQTSPSIVKSSQAVVMDEASWATTRSSTEPCIPQGFSNLPIKIMVVKDLIQALVIMAYMTLGLIFHKVQLGTMVIGTVRRSIIYNNLFIDLKALYDERLSIGQALRSLTLRPMATQHYSMSIFR